MGMISDSLQYHFIGSFFTIMNGRKEVYKRLITNQRYNNDPPKYRYEEGSVMLPFLIFQVN